ncbi:MAG TPA: hypothetical protein VL574_00800 [Stellaceae bacterium]|nr:hypothetical protein [Stellaceae bacterium]
MNDREKAIQAEALERAARECMRLGDLCRLPGGLNGFSADPAEAYELAAAAILRIKADTSLIAVPRIISDESIELVARSLLQVKAPFPASDGTEYFVLDESSEFDNLPRDHGEGTEDDAITQVAVLRLAKTAIETFITRSEEVV